MGHRATVYTVRVRRKRETEDFLPLGDIDDHGISLISALADYLRDLESFDEEETRSVQSSNVLLDGHELFVSVMHGQTGMVADIVNRGGDLLLRQSLDDTSRVRCGCLILLKPAEDMGFLATHVNNGRTIKGLLDKGIQARFREQFPNHVLAIRPFIEGSVFQQAVEDGRILKLKLRRIDRSDDPAETSLGKWITGGTEAKVELTLTPRSRAAYLRSQLPLGFMRGDGQAFGQILEYDGRIYDEAKMVVRLEDGQKRTFTIGDLESGHPIAEDMPNLRFQDGDPTEQSIRAALRIVLDRAIRPPGSQ